jgi:hypothetical protein
MHWGVFTISAAHLYNYIEELPPTLMRLVKELILMLLIKNN